MKLGVAISSTGHALALGWGLFGLAAPPSQETIQVETVPVDIVPVASLGETRAGERSAPLADEASPRPTVRPETFPSAVNAGDNTNDNEPVDSEKAAPGTVRKAVEPRKADMTHPAPLERTDAVSVPVNRPEPVPSTEISVTAATRGDVAPDPAIETATAVPRERPAFKPLSKKVPTPTSRPVWTRARIARAPERKKGSETRQAGRPSLSRGSDFDTDEIAALLNRQDAAGGGAKRNRRAPSLGTETAEVQASLTQNELDALRARIESCRNVDLGLPGVNEIRVRLAMKLTRSGTIRNLPEVEATGGTARTRRIMVQGAERAVWRCQPYDLPAEKYDSWKEVVINFSL